MGHDGLRTSRDSTVTGYNGKECLVRKKVKRIYKMYVINTVHSNKYIYFNVLL